MEFKKHKGVWDSEPDHVEFEHAGLACVIHRNTDHGYHLCGYVGIPIGHPLHGLHSDDHSPALVPLLDRPGGIGDIGIVATLTAKMDFDAEPMATPMMALHCHWGITYACAYKPGDWRRITRWASGRLLSCPADSQWWFGFDCNHCDDFAPHNYYDSIGTYRDIGYVMGNIERLAEQIAGVTE